MAKKREPSLEDSLKTFKDAMLRASLHNYLYVNNILLSKNAKGHSVLIIPDNELWGKILEDEELKDNIKELDISNPDEYQLQQLFSYGEDLDSIEWIDIDPELLFKGKVFKISDHGLEYEIPINKNLIPLKLKKSEFYDIKYRVFIKPSQVLGLKKRFDDPIPGGGFSIIRMFQIV